jgi:hypothetical protein
MPVAKRFGVGIGKSAESAFQIQAGGMAVGLRQSLYRQVISVAGWRNTAGSVQPEDPEGSSRFIL